MVKITFIFVATTLLLSAVIGVSEQKSIELSLHKALQEGVARLVRAVEESPEDSHGHEEDSHGNEAAGTCSITEDALIDEFNELAEHMSLLNSDGYACFIEREGHDSDDEEDHSGEEDDDHDHDEITHGDFDSDHNDTEFEGNITCSSCDTVYGFFKELVSHVGAVPECCLSGNGSSCEATEVVSPSSERPSAAQAYGFGFLMVILVSAGSLFGVLVVPCVKGNKRCGELHKYVYVLMIALGTSALFCDAVLHLIPEAFGLHSHGAEEEGGEAHAHEEGEKEPIPDYIWKGCAIIGGMYLFFLIEVLLHSWNSHRHGHNHSLDADTSTDDTDRTEHSPLAKTTNMNLKETSINTVEATFPHGTCKEVNGSGPKMLHPSGMNTTEDCEDCKERDNCSKCEDKEAKAIEGGNCGVRAWRYILNIKPLAWLIIVGDGLHNFADGLALGAAISQSLALGISTTIALVFHEIPHEFGDYVILLSTGMTWSMALLFNVLSACTAILGFFIGVAIGTASEDVNSWILAVTSGVFLYIALVDLLPELIHSKEKGCVRWGLFAMANLGFVISFIVLLVIAIYEEDLNTLIS